jgi:sorbitol-specific phosphotransferase system component IIBC
MKYVRRKSTGELIHREGRDNNLDKWVKNASFINKIDESDLELVDVEQSEIDTQNQEVQDIKRYRKMVKSRQKKRDFQDLKSTGNIPNKIKYKDLFDDEVD